MNVGGEDRVRDACMYACIAVRIGAVERLVI